MVASSSWKVKPTGREGREGGRGGESYEIMEARRAGCFRKRRR